MQLFPDSHETIDGLGQSLRSGEMKCAGLVEQCLQAIDEHESRIRAWVLVDRDGALQRAAELDAELAAGTDRGALHGIVIGIKDIIDVAGWPTACGSDAWKDTIADVDAPLVARLREAGAIILGKTVTTQYASFDPPETRNPWNVDRTPGGSSSGSAAAVATGMCIGAIGSQTGGSITRPASYCGIAGCKPTHGRVSLRGILPFAANLDHPGPMARCVEDLAILYDVIAGYDAGDPYSADRDVETAILGFEHEHPLPPRLGLLGGLFTELAEADVQTAMEAAVGMLRTAGAEVREAASPQGFDEVLAPHRLVMAAEAAAVHETRFAAEPEDFKPCITQLLNEGLSATVTQYIHARTEQVRLKREILSSFDGFDALICPATTGPAPDTSSTGDPAFNSPWSFTGLPTVSFPIALSADGLPLAIQIVGRPFDEASLFQTARWCERVVRDSQ